MVKMPHWPKPFNLLDNEQSLHRMQAILAAIGSPHLSLPPTVHVAGTNGKGSSIAFLRAMLEADGKKVHVYTTPHLLEFNERIVLAGQQISDDLLFEACETVRVAAESNNIALGFYEATTAAAFWVFAKQPADFLLLETGMGGRLDATNIVPTPAISIITTISLDHQKFLGDSIAQIAFEKAAIIKPRTLCICSMQHDEAFEVIEARCQGVNADLLAFGADFWVEPSATGMLYRSENQFLEFSKPSLVGYHQWVNSASAIAAAFALQVPSNSIERGLVGAKWPSRLELVEKPFVPQGWEFWLDGGHNAAAAYALANHVLDEWDDGKPTYLLFGTTRGRDVLGFVAKFKDSVQHVALVKVNSEPNSYDAEEMLEQLADKQGFSSHQSIHAAVQFLHSHNPAPARVLCCGSLFMRGDVFI